MERRVPTQESAIKAAIQAVRQKIDVGCERGSVVVNGWANDAREVSDIEAGLGGFQFPVCLFVPTMRV